jgi:hypothetical protein
MSSGAENSDAVGPVTSNSYDLEPLVGFLGKVSEAKGTRFEVFETSTPAHEATVVRVAADAVT